MDLGKIQQTLPELTRDIAEMLSNVAKEGGTMPATRTVRSVFLFLIATSPIAILGQATSQHTSRVHGASSALPGNIRPQRVFVSNVGSDSDQTFKWGTITGGPGQAFNKFYALIQSSRLFQVVNSPSQADAVLEMSYVLVSEEVSKRVKDK